MRRALLALTLTLAAWPAFAQKAVIQGPETVPKGSAILLDARQSEGQRLLWRLVEGDESAFATTFDKDGRADVALFVPVAPEGVLTYALVAVGEPDDEGVPSLDIALHRVQVGPPPAPEPEPGPAPGPTPTPVVTGQLFVSYVVGSDPTQAESAIRADSTLRSTLDGLDAVWRTYRSDEPDIDRLKLGPHLQAAGGTPAVLIQDETGQVLTTLHAPTPEQITAAVRAYRGG